MKINIAGFVDAYYVFTSDLTQHEHFLYWVNKKIAPCNASIEITIADKFSADMDYVGYLVTEPDDESPNEYRIKHIDTLLTQRVPLFDLAYEVAHVDTDFAIRIMSRKVEKLFFKIKTT